MQLIKKKIREYVGNFSKKNFSFNNFSPMDLDFFNLMNSNNNNSNSFSQIFNSNFIGNITNEDEIMIYQDVNCDKIDDKYDFSMNLD